MSWNNVISAEILLRAELFDIKEIINRCMESGQSEGLADAIERKKKLEEILGL
jgi:hypothetical protein